MYDGSISLSCFRFSVLVACAHNPQSHTRLRFDIAHCYHFTHNNFDSEAPAAHHVLETCHEHLVIYIMQQQHSNTANVVCTHDSELVAVLSSHKRSVTRTHTDSHTLHICWMTTYVPVCSCALQQSQAGPRSQWRLFVQSSALRGDLRLPLFYSLIVLLLYPQHCLNKRFTVTGLPHQLACC